MTENEKQVLISNLGSQISVIQQQIQRILDQKSRYCPNDGSCIKTSCKSDWSCGDWSICGANGQQTKICSDKKNCLTPTNLPQTVKSCTPKPALSITANGSPSDIVLFLPLGGGANVNSDGTITLRQSINLGWNGVLAASCRGSDRLGIFSGFKPTQGSENVVLSGKITPSSNSYISDTFTLSCKSIETGYDLTVYISAKLFYTVNYSCYPVWICSDWGACSYSSQSRTCYDQNGCGTTISKPAEKQSCTIKPKS